MLRLTTLRAAAAIAALGAMALAGCGGGSSSSVGGTLPTTSSSASGAPPTQLTTANGSTVQAGQLSITVPVNTGAAAQSAGRVTALSTAKKPTYIDTTTKNSSVVVAVTPQNPAEAAQYGSLTVCYNLYVNGTLAAQAPPNFTYTAAGNTVATVTLAIPAPPGTDGYQITQYAGLCGSTPYTLPTPPPGTLGTNGILAQTPVTYADIEPGVVNNLNNQIANCPAQTVPCPLGLGGVPVPPAGTLAASIAIAQVQFGTVPIPNPVREQGAFILATGKIGVPIPLQAVNAAGVVVPGLTTAASPLAGAGPFPNGVTVTDGDASGHTKLYLVDAATGAIAQGPGTSVKIHEFNILQSNTIAGLTNNCDAGAASCSDALVGGTAGDPWVIVMTFDGVAPATLASATITATATAPNAALPAPGITTTITPQAAVYTAGGTGYPDLAAPAAPSDLIQVGAVNYFTDGASVKVDGVAPGAACPATALGGLTSATWPNATTFEYAVDSAQTQVGAPFTAEVGSGLYAFNAAGAFVASVSAAAGANNFVKFLGPVAVVQATGPAGAGHPYLFVVDSAGAIYRLDISSASEIAPVGGFQQATNVLPVLTVTGQALNPNGAKMLGTVALNGGATWLVADPGNNRIAQVDTSSGNAAITTFATGAPFTGLFLSGTAVYASSTTGQIYYISGSGATPVSLGLATGTAIDGPIGQLASLTPTAAQTLTPVNYGLQFQAKSFFDTVGPTTGLASPYTLAPFNGTKVFAIAPAAGVGLLADTSAGAATGAGLIKANGGLIVVAPGATAGAVVTPDSILFVDGAGAAGAKLRTIAR